MISQDLPTKLAYKLADAAALLSVSVVTLRRAINNGTLKPIRNIRHILLGHDELLRFVGSQPTPLVRSSSPGGKSRARILADERTHRDA